MNSPTKSEVIIYGYENYRTFLKDRFAELRQTDPETSFRNFSKKAGIRTSNYLLLVINGTRNLTEKTIAGFALALHLTREETAYFRELVWLNQAENLQQRQFHAQNLLRTRGFRKHKPLAESQYQYYTQWYYVALCELINCGSFVNDETWIRRALYDKVTITQIRDAIEDLLRLELIRRESGKLRLNHQVVVTPDEVTSHLVSKFHEEMGRLGIEAITSFSSSEREIGGLTFGVSKERFQEVKTMIQNFRHELTTLLVHETAADKVYQLNLQLFPVATLKPEDKS